MTQLSFFDGDSVELNNIFCIGRNFVDHIEELKNERPEKPLIFVKPSSAILLEGNDIELPLDSDDVHYETELVVLLKSGGRHLTEQDAKAAIYGYAVGLDLTARDWQAEAKKKGLPWAMAKGFDGSASVSRFVKAKNLPDHQALTFTMCQNGVLKQQGETRLMLFSIIDIIVYLSRYMTLQKGDVIYTGTPSGVGKLHDGDLIELKLLDKYAASFSVVAPKKIKS